MLLEHFPKKNIPDVRERDQSLAAERSVLRSFRSPLLIC